MAGELILVVEDNERNAKLLRDVLSVTGYRVTHTVTAEEGLEVVRRDKPDLILMDIQLPGMSGTAALDQLKAAEDTRHIPVIAVTASAMPMERQEILEAGFDGYQAKPISVKAVMAEVRTLLDRAGRGAT
jgi:CheY-like chemotaxis protein